MIGNETAAMGHLTIPNRRTVESAVALACRAPSIHNNQPWWSVTGPDHLMFQDDDRPKPR